MDTSTTIKTTIITTDVQVYAPENFTIVDTVDLLINRSKYDIKQMIVDAKSTDNREELKDLVTYINSEATDINLSGNPLVFDLISITNTSTKPVVVYCSEQELLGSVLLSDNDLDFLLSHNNSVSKRLMFTTVNKEANVIQIIEPYKHIVETLNLDEYTSKANADVTHEFVYTEPSLPEDFS